jgi:hypothetical protein
MVSVQELIDVRGCGDEEIRCGAAPLEHLGLKFPVHGHHANAAEASAPAKSRGTVARPSGERLRSSWP